MTLPSGSTAGIWKIDPAHSVVEFRVRHMMISNVKGHFTGVEGFTNRRLGGLGCGRHLAGNVGPNSLASLIPDKAVSHYEERASSTDTH